MPQKINYKSDFSFILRLYDNDGEEIGFPTFDFDVVLRADGYNSFKASRRGDTLVNCYDDAGRLHIVCDGHRLGTGRLAAEFYADPADSVYPDGRRMTVTPQTLDIELVREAAPVVTTVEAEALLPYVYVTAYDMARRAGYQGTMEQYVEVVGSMPELAGRVAELVREVNAAAETAIAASDTAQSAAQTASDAAEAVADAGVAATEARNAATVAASAAARADEKLTELNEIHVAQTDVENQFTADQYLINNTLHSSKVATGQLLLGGVSVTASNIVRKDESFRFQRPIGFNDITATVGYVRDLEVQNLSWHDMEDHTFTPDDIAYLDKENTFTQYCEFHNISADSISTDDVYAAKVTLQKGNSMTVTLTGDNVALNNYDNNFTASQTFRRDVHVLGRLILDGAAAEVHAEVIKTKNDKIILREGAVSGIPAGDYAGLVAEKYNGRDDGYLVYDQEGARVGKVGDTEPLLTRDEAVNMVPFQPLIWDAQRKRAVSGQFPEMPAFRYVDMTVTYEDDSTETFMVMCAPAQQPAPQPQEPQEPQEGAEDGN